MSEIRPVIPAAASFKQSSFWQLNIFIVLAIGCNLLNLVYYLADSMLWSAAVEAAGILILIVFAIGNSKGFFETTKFLSVVMVNAHAFALCYIQGLAGGTYLYLFPFVLAMIFLVRVRRNNRQLWVYGGITLTTLIAIVCFIPPERTMETANAAAYHPHLILNIILNFVLLILFFYLMLQLLDAKERRIKSEKALADVILNTSLHAVLIVDQKTLLITQYNDRTAELFSLVPFHKNHKHLPVSEVLGKKPEQQLERMKTAEAPLTNWQDDVQFTTSDHRGFHGLTSIVRFAHKEAEFFKVSVLDITPIKTAEFETLKAKETAERAAVARTRFMSNMSHELRTPLNAIIGTANLLLQEESSGAAAEHYAILKHASEHMLELVNSVLDFNKLEAGMIELTVAPFHIAETIKHTAASFTNAVREKALTLQLQLDNLAQLPKVMGDELRFKQVVMNLISNAVKFTEQGTITVTARLEQQEAGRATIYIAVSDTGIGIAPDKCRLIFNSFTQADAGTTRRYGGSGLGLSICSELVKQMGGTLEMTSDKGKGSCFHFTLTLPVMVQSEAALQNNPAPKKLSKLPGVQVLMAEDSVVNARIAKRFLDGWEVQTDIAGNGRIALERFVEKKYDVLLIDLEMPEMDGKQFLKEVRHRNKTIPAIAFTASIYDNMYDDLKQHGFDGFVHKTFRPEELHGKIAEFAAQPKPPA